MVSYGGAILSTHVLPQWVGRTTIVYSLAGLGLLGFTGDAPPFLHHLMPLLLGILLLLLRAQIEPENCHEKEWAVSLMVLT